MFEIYLPVLLMIAVAVTIPTLLFVLGTVLGPRRPTAEKLIPYESGSETTGAANVRLSVKFYLTAILFVVFDIEAVFIYPWAVIFDDVGLFGFVAMAIFIVLLLDGYIYAWKKGALEWV